MNIVFHKKSGIFHLFNKKISYLMMLLPNGHLGHLYFGKKIHDRDDFSHLVRYAARPSMCNLTEDLPEFSLGHSRLEYPVYGTTDYRQPAVEVIQENGSRLSDFPYVSHTISSGKPALPGLPATWCENKKDAMTLKITCKDPVTGLKPVLSYTIFEDFEVVARSVQFTNEGTKDLHLGRAMSLSVDLMDSDYEWVHFAGAWARERHMQVQNLAPGILSIGSLFGASSHEHNPFVILKRPNTDEFRGEALGFALLYSGNFLAQTEVDNMNITRVMIGVHPETFDWKLSPGESFQTPEAVMAYSSDGLNHLSQAFHKLYSKHLTRGIYRNQPRPILINNWEATYFDFTEESVLEIAKTAKDCGIELFVLDDGWFGVRNDDHSGLGDWYPNLKKLPNGVKGLSEKVEALGLKFGIWIEPEMVNPDSDLFRAHPDWILHTPGRTASFGRHQYVLDYSRPEVVDHIYEKLAKLLTESKISYIKWDMNRYITECYNASLPADRQGEVFHRYILGVYDLYDRLTTNFPHVLFESCASGGARFDAGLLYYAPQAWTSDDSDAYERQKIQYATSYGYPVSAMGAHVSAVPNHQVHRITPFYTRANVAYFGTFGYELDLNRLTCEELEEVKRQITFMKNWRPLIQYGTFYRLLSPFEGNETAWIVVSDDKTAAVAGWYKTLNTANTPFKRLRFAGLDPDICYQIEDADGNPWSDKTYYGDELMNIGIFTTDSISGLWGESPLNCDFDSRVYVLKEARPDSEKGTVGRG